MLRKIALTVILGSIGGLIVAVPLWRLYASAGGVGVECRGRPEGKPFLYAMRSVGPSSGLAILLGLATGPLIALLFRDVLGRRFRYPLAASLVCLWGFSLWLALYSFRKSEPVAAYDLRFSPDGTKLAGKADDLV